ncbi:MAG: protein phosphatase [Salinirussus sp.]
MGTETVVYRAYRFGPADPAEPHVYGACAPGWHVTGAVSEAVEDWIAFMRGRHVERVCSIVPGGDHAGAGNLRRYREEFGRKHVTHAPIPDGRLPDLAVLRDDILPFLASARANDTRAVVVGLTGVGRTGVVLAGWLIRHRGFDVQEAIGTVREVGRDPRAVVERGEPSRGDLHDLLAALN